MKLHLDRAAARYLFTGYGPDHVEVNGQRHQRGLIVLPDEIIPDWCEHLAGLSAAHFEVLLMRAPEIILLGTGRRQVFPKPAQYAGPIRAGIGIEVMDSQAACRTYNILAAEGRRVAAALIIEAE
jgi:uncharacterized protein